MSENSGEKSKLTFKEMTFAKRSKILFFVLNLALIVPFVVRNYSPVGLGGAALIMLLAFYVIVIRPDIDAPATKDVPRLLFFDVLLCLVVSYQDLIDYFLLGDLDYIITDVEGGSLTLLVIGLAVSLFVPKKPHLVWLKSLGKTLIGVSIIMIFWSDGELLNPTFYFGGESFLAFFLLWAIAWIFFCMIAGRLDSNTIKRNGRLTNILLLLLAVICLAENELIRYYAFELKDLMLAIPTQGFVWWKVLLAVVVLLGCAAASYDYENNTAGVDAMVLAVVASGIILLKALLCNYFSFSWIVFAVFLFSSFRCIRNEKNHIRTLRLTNPVYLAVQLAVLLITVWLMAAGLWINVVIIAVYTYLFYTGIGKERTHKQELRWWITILSAPAVFAIAYIWQMRFSLETLLLIVVSFVVMTAVMIILNLKHPEGIRVPREYKILMCIFMILLCGLSMARFGSKVDVEFDSATSTVQVDLEARGKDNRVTSVVYSWSDLTGKTTVEESMMSVYGANIPIQGEKLTVIVTDANGVTTTKTAWYPSWLMEE